jgi:cell wall-associated NlpC family hydrolase
MSKYIILCFLFIFILVSDNKAQAFDFEEDVDLIIPDSENPEQTPATETELIAFAKKYLGTPYKYTGTTPKGFDCSGFVYFVFNEFGTTLPHSSRDIAKIGEKVTKQDLQVGDLVFFEGRTRNGVVGHVGIICGIDGDAISFIHASTNRNVIISDMKEEYYAVRFLHARRIHTTSNTIG